MASVSMKITQRGAPLLAQFRSKLPGVDRRAIFELTSLGVTIIQERTRKGLDQAGRPFTGYSKKPYRAPVANRPAGYPSPSGGTPSKSGKTVLYEGGYGEYKGAGGFGTTPNLSVSGRMLGAIKPRAVTATLGEIFYTSREEAAKGHGHQFGTTTTKREHFGLDAFQDEQQMRCRAVRLIRLAAARARLRLEGNI